jgi:cell volume regulation protein A
MDLNLFFALLGALLVLAFVANRMVRYTAVPDVLILMATGLIIGPVLHWVKAEQFQRVSHGFGSLALMLILFEGGLDLKLREILRHFAGGFFLSIFSLRSAPRAWGWRAGSLYILRGFPHYWWARY